MSFCLISHLPFLITILSLKYFVRRRALDQEQRFSLLINTRLIDYRVKMVVELRKRKAPPAQPEPVKKKTATVKATKKAPKDEQATEEVKSKSSTTSKAVVPKVGDVISLEGFGGELQTQDGESTTLESLVASSKAGVVLFTYPRASTPGCKFLRPEV